MTSTKNAILLLAHGSPDQVEEIPEFLLQVTGGRPLPAHVIAEVEHRYQLIGSSPLTRWTFSQRDLLARELRLPVHVGMRNWKPFVADAVRAMNQEGATHVVALCLAPQNSRTSVGLYRAALAKEERRFSVDFVDSWHNHPLLIKAFAEKLQAGWRVACKEAEGKVPVIFTAHSVPQRTIAEGDPYEAQSKETATLVAREAGLRDEDWTFAFQSQGMAGGAWLGPTVEDTIGVLREQGHRGVFIAPIGFLCDHVEVLYDIDIGFKRFARQQAMRLWRSESLNDSGLLTATLVDIARTRLGQASPQPWPPAP